MRIKTIASSSSGCCYLVDSCGEQLIIEMGVPVKKIRQALNFDLSKVVGCVVSHEHGDHAKYLPELERTGIPIWCTVGTRNTYNLSGRIPIDLAEFNTFGEIFRVHTVKLEHDCLCFGFIIDDFKMDRLAYFTDTGHVNFKVPGITHLMIEANHSFESMIKSDNKFLTKRISDYHLSIEDVEDFCTRHKNTLQEIHLIHLSDSNSDEVDFQKRIAGITGVPVYVAGK